MVGRGKNVCGILSTGIKLGYDKEIWKAYLTIPLIL